MEEKKTERKIRQEQIRLGTHGEDYGSWMSTPTFCIIGGVALLFVLAAFLLGLPRRTVLGVLFGLAAVALLAVLFWFAWIRRQYSFRGGRAMEQVHRGILSHMDYDGKGRILEVGCGSGALAIRAALTWPEAEAVGVDYWGMVYSYSKSLCETNAKCEGVADRCTFVHGNAVRLDFPDESFDAVMSNYVYHNISGVDKQKLLLESLRVLKKGGVFALHDIMQFRHYGDMEAFAQSLRDSGYQEVRLIDTAQEFLGSQKRADLLLLGASRLLVGRK